MSEYTVFCPRCGKRNSVGEDSGTVTCRFCGEQFAKPTTSPVPPSGPPQAPEASGAEAEEDWRPAFDDAVRLLDENSCVDPSGIRGSFNRAEYPGAFETYYARLLPALERFDRAFDLCGGEERGALPRRFAAEFGERIQRGFTPVKVMQDEEQEKRVFLYVAFAVPAVSKFGKSYSEAMADALLATWNDRFPKRKLGKATYEQINAGFRHKILGCYITTAVTSSLGRGDGCYELNAFRRFRDGWLKNQPGGEADVQEYYLTAPFIVRAIDSSPRSGEIYRGIWERHLRRCLGLLERGEYGECRRAYTAMVGELREKWL